MKIKQHIPSACEGLDQIEVEFSTTEELLQIPFVLSFRMDVFDKDRVNPYFKRYSISSYMGNMFGRQVDLLMAEFNTDEKWKESHLVVGYISRHENEKLDLPIFEEKTEEK